LPSTKFDAYPEDVLQFIKNFTQHWEETGVIEDFNFIVKENPQPDDVDMDDTIARTKWITAPCQLTNGHLLINSSDATMENVEKARYSLLADHSSLKSVPDPKKQPSASRK